MKTLILFACTAVVGTTFAAPGNPYQSIAARNVFRLEPIVIAPPPPQPPPVRRVPAAIFITGVLGIGGVPKALVEVNEPGKPVHRHIVCAGTGLDALEVLDINVGAGAVRVRRDGAEETLTLQTPKAAPPLPPLAVPPKPPMPPAPPMPPRASAAWRG